MRQSNWHKRWIDSKKGLMSIAHWATFIAINTLLNMFCLLCSLKHFLKVYKKKWSSLIDQNRRHKMITTILLATSSDQSDQQQQVTWSLHVVSKFCVKVWLFPEFWWSALRLDSPRWRYTCNWCPVGTGAQIRPRLHDDDIIHIVLSPICHIRSLCLLKWLNSAKLSKTYRMFQSNV